MTTEDERVAQLRVALGMPERGDGWHFNIAVLADRAVYQPDERPHVGVVYRTLTLEAGVPTQLLRPNEHRRTWILENLGPAGTLFAADHLQTLRDRLWMISLVPGSMAQWDAHTDELWGLAAERVAVRIVEHTL